ncbi:hypothetical protein GWK47_028003 [Chionoecetes opilio]|uniref:Uncharacterized protein n=1 Tax=Chionoecetes opilio TaxID=41210 RepID=A0A8J4YLP4_CHIOP|nr:hypothetical protein GWK47_028003 [Chionoecetes opilio]
MLAGELCSGENTGNGCFSVPRCRTSSGREAAVWGAPLPLQEAVKVLGVEVDRELRFDGHIKHTAKKASHRVSALRKVASFLDRGGNLLLYKAQIRSVLEYAALSWMSCAASHTRRLDSIQRRALRLVDAADPTDPPDTPAQFEPVSPLDSLEHRRDVAALVVFHKAQGAGTATPGWVTTASENRHAKHENGAYQW